MKMMTPSQYSLVLDELNEYFTLCNKHNRSPNKEDISDILKFILLFHGSATGLCESDSDNFVDHLYESNQINEDSTYDPSKDTESAAGLAIAAGGAAVAGATIGAIKVGEFVKYLFKKGKVKKAIQKETEAEINKLKGYKELAALKRKMAELGGEDVGKISVPGMAKGGDLESSSDKEN